MLIMFEGADGTGKSSFINRLTRDLIDKYYIIMDAEHWLDTYPNSADRLDKRQLIKNIVNLAKDKDRIFLADRGPISDIVYRLFDDYKSVLTMNEMIGLLDTLKRNLFVVYAHTTEAEKRMLERGDNNDIAVHNHKQICKAYDIVMTALKLLFPNNIIDYDFASRYNDYKNCRQKIDFIAQLLVNNRK